MQIYGLSGSWLLVLLYYSPAGMALYMSDWPHIIPP